MLKIQNFMGIVFLFFHLNFVVNLEIELRKTDGEFCIYKYFEKNRLHVFFHVSNSFIGTNNKIDFSIVNLSDGEFLIGNISENSIDR